MKPHSTGPKPDKGKVFTQGILPTFGEKTVKKSGVTSLAGFAGARLPQTAGTRTIIPAVFCQAPAVFGYLLTAHSVASNTSTVS